MVELALIKMFCNFKLHRRRFKKVPYQPRVFMNVRKSFDYTDYHTC